MVMRAMDKEPQEVQPGMLGTVLSCGERLTMVEMVLVQGVRVSRRQHPHEEVIYVVRGTAFFRVNDRGIALAAGESVLIPSNTIHSGEALTDCTLITAYAPPIESLQELA